MKRLKISNEKAPNFIGCWYLENQNICDEMIDFFEKNKDLHQQGSTSRGIDIDRKKTTDITINPKDLNNVSHKMFKAYFENLQECYSDYKEQWPFLKTFLNKINIGSFNVQKYLPGDHFSALHSERTHISTIHRVFAFMTYLNDVEDGGTTDFEFYGLKIKPEKGKTLIWPSEWTHAHTGSVLKGGSKYIITGWLYFPV